MKKILSIITIVFLAITLLPFYEMTTKAETEYQEGCFTYMVSDDEAIITKYDASANNGYVTIPSTLNGYPVTEIGAWVFYGDASLTSISIPNSVRSIGESTFYGCSALENVFIKDIESWCNIDFADRAANPLKYAENLYVNGTLVTEVRFPANLVKIGNYAFGGYKQLKNVYIPSGVTSIGDCAFMGCTGLVSINTSSCLSTIGNYTFNGCEALTSISIPSSVTSIGEYAFDGCSQLNSVYITDLTAWCNIDFAGRSANPLSYAENLYLNEKKLTEIKVPENVTSIGNYAFSAYEGLISIDIPSSVISIGDYAFNACTGLRYIEIPESVTSIGKYAFSWCSSLKNVKILEGLRSIGSNAFHYSGLTSIELPGTLEEINEYAFYGCDSLKDIYYNGTENEWKNINCMDNLWDYKLHYLKIVVTGVELSLVSKRLYEDETLVLEAKVFPEDATNKNIFWETSNPKIATVNDGVVTAISPGTAIITVVTEDGARTATCEIEVVFCETHKYSEWIKNDNDKHSRSCLLCGTVEEGVHIWNLGTITQAASCTVEGKKTYECNYCKALKTEAIGILDHEVTEEWILDKVPTNSEVGSKSRYCTRCDLAIESIEIPKIECNHSDSEYKEIKSASCKTNGLWERRCNECDAIIASGEISSHAHNIDNGKIAKKPTCTENGRWEIRCKDCDYLISTEEIPSRNGHYFENVLILVTPYYYDEVIVQCWGCSITNSIKVTPCHGRGFYRTEIRGKSCIYESYMNVFCSVCDEKLGSVDIGVAGHNLNYRIEELPTCYDSGYWKQWCSKCDACTETSSIPALWHDGGYYIETFQASCASSGHWERRCNICDGMIDSGSIQKTAHQYKYVICESSTCSTNGKTEIHCEDCNVVIEKINIKKLDHKYLEEWKKDSDGHWLECSGCSTKKNMVNHTYGPINNDICSICGWDKDVYINPTETEAPKPTETEAPKPTETEAAKPTETEAPKPTETEAPKPTETEAAKPTETEAPKPTETEAAKPTETEAAKPTETEAPKPTETEVPKPTETEVPKPTETEVPKLTETEAPKPTETEASKPTETEVPKPTETEVPKPTETEVPKPTETEVPKPTVDVTSVFDDVYNDWYKGYVQYVYDNNLMTGIKGTRHFAPNNNITKAQIAQVLYNMEGQPGITNLLVFSELKDVYTWEWYANAVAWAYNTGVVTGDTNAKKFFPNADVTREQLAIMMYRYAKYKGVDTSVTSDLAGLKNAKNTADWALDGVKWAVGTGLISGIEKNGVKDLAPQGNASRAQMAAILQRFCENVR